ncbi:UNVERIFIED_CONTAM: Zeatin O-xylosyltransferase [Sesamum latifolium]|uniref:Glycosyltransferase n=1 Tax=Sesamum latifolium TaxID=2727402 RepID=A0AAW2VK11_9LAMI
MGSLSNQQSQHDDEMTSMEQVAVIMVPFAAQGHLNQLMQLSCLISSYALPVFYISSATHIRQARVRVNGLNPLDLAKIHFHDIPIPPFASLLHRTPTRRALRCSRRDASVLCIQLHSCILSGVFVVEGLLDSSAERLKELQSLQGCIPEKVLELVAIQAEPLKYRAGDLYNTCRLIEAHYLDLLEKEESDGNKKIWAIGPILPTKLSSSQNKCLEWLDQQDPKSVIYVSFGTTVSLSDEQIKELALGLEQSKVKFLWVLRDADKGDIFDGEVRRAELPEGFEERVKEVGMVVRDWAPQPEILAHESTGGFMSHCGWNSCIESITMGVPTAAWPMHSDQPRNTMFVTQVLNMGIVVKEWEQRAEIVKASAVENAVRRLMASEEGDEIRKRAAELAATLRQATEPGGASRLELDSFVAHINKMIE